MRNILIVTLLAVLTFWTTDILIVWDMTEYLSLALNLFNGQGFVDIDWQSNVASMVRGPVFPGLMAGSFHLLGPSPESAFWVVRLFAVLAPVAVYLLGGRLYGPSVGLAAGLLYLTAFTINRASYTHIDVVWPVFVICATYFLAGGLETRRRSTLILAGVFYGLAYLTKEAAVVFFAVPGLVWLCATAYRTRQGFVDAVIVTASIVLSILPWVIWVYQKYQALPLLGVVGPWVLQEILNPAHNLGAENSSSLFEVVTGFFQGLYDYYGAHNRSWSNQLVLAPLMLLSWLGLAIYAIRKRSPQAVILVVSAVLYLPILYFVGRNDWRVGQSIVFYQLSYICLAAALYLLCQWRLKFKKRSAFVPAVVVLIAFQVFIPNGQKKTVVDFYKRSAVLDIAQGEGSDLQVRGWFNDPRYAPLMDYIHTHIKTDESLIVEGYPVARALYFNLGGRYQIHDTPVIYCLKQGSYKSDAPVDKDELPVHLESKSQYHQPHYRILMIYQSRLLDMIRETGARYMISADNSDGFHAFLDHHPGFAAVSYPGMYMGSKKGLLRLYKINPDQLSTVAFRTVVTASTRAETKDMAKNDPARYTEILKRVTTCTGGNLTSGEYQDLTGVKLEDAQ